MFDFKTVKEASRTYHYAGGRTVQIVNVCKVFVKPDTGTHRLEDEAGKKWIVPAGWLAISFEGDWVF